MFGRWFNQKVNNLPLSLNYLKFGYDFNQKIDNLPLYLKKIIVSSRYTEISKIPFGCELVLRASHTLF